MSETLKPRHRIVQSWLDGKLDTGGCIATLESALTAERERADRNQEDAERWRTAEPLFEHGYEMEDGTPALALFLPSEAGRRSPNAAIDSARRK